MHIKAYKCIRIHNCCHYYFEHIFISFSKIRKQCFNFTFTYLFSNTLPFFQFSSVTQLCLTLCNLMDCSMPDFPVHHQLPELAQTHVHQICDAIQPSYLCCPLFLLPSIFPSITVFSNESALPIRWPKYWSFSFSISPSNEYSGLISFRIDRFIFN